MTDLTNQSIGRYHILEQLGQGGMATVYKAYDTRLEREVALKLIRTDLFGNAVLERILKRFEREAKSMAKLDHPGIVKVYDYGEHKGSPYLVMQYLPSGTLKEMLGKPVDCREAAQLLLPVARALAYAHAHGVLHRDVKPSNILINERGEAVLTDFGIAKLLEGEEGHTLTGTGVGVGTPEYMAPEQGLGKEVDGRADVYGLGVVLYEMVTGRKPYEAETPLAVLLKQVNDPLPRPKQYIPDLPDEVERVIFKALAKKPEDRYETMAAFAAALEGLGHVQQGSAPVSQLSAQKIDHIPPPLGNLPRQVHAQPAEPETVDMQAFQIDEKYTIRKGKQSRKLWPVFLSVGALFLIAAVIINKLNTGVPAIPVNSTKSSTAEERIVTDAPVELTPTKTPVKVTPTALPLEVAVTPTSESSNGSTLVREKDGMTMVYVPAGEFKMGSNNGWDDEQPVHTPYLDEFWIDQTEVTNAMYARCVADGACDWHYDTFSSTRSSYFGNPKFDNYPVINVSWYDANAYCQWVGGQLPTEAQWEKASGGVEDYPWGDFISRDRANYNRIIGDTTEVGTYPFGASPYGVLDMAGNVWEWVADWYEEDYYRLSPSSNPMGPSEGTDRIMRGGSWLESSSSLKSSFRFKGNPNDSGTDLGFRCTISP